MIKKALLVAIAVTFYGMAASHALAETEFQPVSYAKSTSVLDRAAARGQSSFCAPPITVEAYGKTKTESRRISVNHFTKKAHKKYGAPFAEFSQAKVLSFNTVKIPSTVFGGDPRDEYHSTLTAKPCYNAKVHPITSSLKLVAVSTGSSCSGDACGDVNLEWNGSCYSMKNYGGRRVFIQLGRGGMGTITMTLRPGQRITFYNPFSRRVCLRSVPGSMKAKYV